MKLHFYKYQGAGNDFILADNRDGKISFSQQQVARLCDRRFGIGADGLMLLEPADGFDFRMTYYNSDGNESTMCGNGGRCITAFARHIGAIGSKATFIAIDGPHEANIDEQQLVHLAMQDVAGIEFNDGYAILNTGSPHYVKWVPDVDKQDVFHIGRQIRNQQEFQPKGINVNFVQKTGNDIKVRTYERGVEDETLSCGTGVTASAIATVLDELGTFDTTIHAPGGILNVSFTKDAPHTAKNVILTGPAVLVFEGDITI